MMGAEDVDVVRLTEVEEKCKKRTKQDEGNGDCGGLL